MECYSWRKKYPTNGSEKNIEIWNKVDAEARRIIVMSLVIAACRILQNARQ